VQAVLDELTGTPGADTLVDASGDARLFGLSGNDRLQGGSGNDALDGGGGTDTAVYAGAASGYRVARTGTGWPSRTRMAATAPTRSAVERLDFTDRDLELVAPARIGCRPWRVRRAVRSVYTLGASPTAGHRAHYGHRRGSRHTERVVRRGWHEAGRTSHRWV
jgi:hypothetical protein